MRATLTLLVCLLLGGCGTATARPAAEQSTPASSSPGQDGATPQWPPHGCDQHVAGTFDFAFPVPGFPSPEEAASRYVEPGDQLVRQEEQPAHYARGWMIVTSDNEIRAVVTMLHSKAGYVVDSAETCAGSSVMPGQRTESLG